MWVVCGKVLGLGKRERLMETQAWFLPAPAGCIGGGLNKGIIVPVCTLVLEKAAPPALARKPDHLVPPHVSLELLQLLSLCWSLRWVFAVNLYSGPLNKTSESLMIFTASCCEEFLFLAVVFQAGEPSVGTPHFSVGTSTEEISFLILNCHMWIWDQPVSLSLPRLPFSMWLLLYVLSYKTSVQPD